MRTFETGATRDQDENKPDFEGFLSPLVLDRYAEYMHKHRKQADGTLRDSDNWQKGIPLPAYMKSGFRHFLDWWKEHRGHRTKEGLEEALCALIFNASGYLHEVLRDRNSHDGIGLNIIPPPNYDPDSVAFSVRDGLAELAREAQSWGMYASADTPEKSPLEPTRIATPEEMAAIARMRSGHQRLDVDALRVSGIGDVPKTARTIYEEKIAIDTAWDAWRARTKIGTPAETAYLASFAPNPHPMMAETLRDEYERTDGGTGL